LARARRSGGATAPYAAYADAVAAVRADSASAPAALDSLVALAALAAQADPAVAGRAGVTAAQLAYELGRYQQAALLAAAVRSRPAVGDALLVRGWALYKDGVMSEAAAAFDEHARARPASPTRGEAELLAAQALLVAGRTPEAGRRFRAAADSAAVALEALERGGAALSAAAAASLLERGAVADLWLAADGLTLGAPAGRMFDAATLAAVVSGGAPAVAPAVAAVVAVAGARDSVDGAPRESAAHARLRLAAPDPARAVAVRRELTPALRRVTAARAAAQTARAAAERDDAVRQAAVATLAAARRELALDRQQISNVERRLTASAATLARAAAPPRAGSAARRRAAAAAGETTAGDRARADSLAPLVEELRSVARTAAVRAAEADRRIELLAAGASSSAGARQAQAVASADAERAAAETALAAAVTREMEQRRVIAVAGLRRDVEAAEFASASAAFFAASGGGVARPVEVVRPTRRPAPVAPPAP
jgi:hypothetical protein